MLDYSKLSKEELKNEINSITKEISELQERNTDDEKYIEQYAKDISMRNNEIDGLIELKQDLLNLLSSK